MTNARKKKIMMKMNEKDLEDKITVHSVNKRHLHGPCQNLGYLANPHRHTLLTGWWRIPATLLVLLLVLGPRLSAQPGLTSLLLCLPHLSNKLYWFVITKPDAVVIPSCSEFQSTSMLH